MPLFIGWASMSEQEQQDYVERQAQNVQAYFYAEMKGHREFTVGDKLEFLLTINQNYVSIVSEAVTVTDPEWRDVQDRIMARITQLVQERTQKWVTRTLDFVLRGPPAP